MKLKINFFFIILLFLAACNSWSKQGENLPFRDTTLTLEARVKDLIGRMSLDEKIGQMQYNAPAIERLGVSAYNWWNEGLHGVGGAGLATIFPQAIGMAASWNEQLIHDIATAISDEARAKHHKLLEEGKQDIYEGLTFWTPSINIFHDPRWGRGQETYGEDPYLTSRMAVNFIKGLQGDDSLYLKLIATAKHFAVHSGSDSSCHSINMRISKQDLYETYLPAFEASAKEGNVQSVMYTYNRLENEVCCDSNLLLQSILRNDWKFKGYVVSDCGAIVDFYESHKVVKTPDEAAALAVNMGTDLNYGSTFSYLKEAVEKGLITEDKIDQALYRLFEARFRLGMFDHPDSSPWKDLSFDVVHSEKHQQIALKASRESVVLLKNKNNILPLSKDIRSIAVIGPNADHKPSMQGNYYGTSPHVVTPLEGIRQKLGDQVKINYAEGTSFAAEFTNLKPIPAAVLSSQNHSGLKGEYYDNINFEGKPSFSNYDTLIDFTWVLETPVTHQMADSFAVRWTGYIEARKTGEHYIAVEAGNAVKLYFEDSLYVDFDHVNHPLQKSFAVKLERGKKYKIAIDYYNYGPDPQMHLLWSEPGQQLEAEALVAARNSDVVVLFMGLTPQLEGEQMPVKIKGFAGGDRTEISLPATQENLITEITALGKPTILVLLGGSAVAINWADKNLPAILEAWYPGEQGGTAIADILFGDYNPSGKLPVTFYASVSDLPAFENYNMENRTYKFFKGEPLYPFGYGLSYTKFEYQNLQMTDTAWVTDTIGVKVEVKNIGERAGDEVVQLYVADHQASVRIPTHSLQGFQKIHLEPGEMKTVIFSLTPKQFAVITEGGNFLIEPGTIKISVGGIQPGLSTKFIPGNTQVLSDSLVLKGENVLL